MLNSITLIGRLVADPELKTTSSGIPVCSFRIACERDFADKQTGERQTDFIDIVAWRQTAEFVTRYFKKGQFIAIQGSLQSRKWQDKDGNNRTAWEVQASSVYFCESKGAAQRENDNTPEPTTSVPEPGGGFAPMPDSDLPF